MSPFKKQGKQAASSWVEEQDDECVSRAAPACADCDHFVKSLLPEHQVARIGFCTCLERPAKEGIHVLPEESCEHFRRWLQLWKRTP